MSASSMSGPAPTGPLAVPEPANVSQELSRFTLDNGLRVVLAPQRSSAVVGVAVLYDVGIRSEPEGRTGFAHLFEHLMFQGSEQVGKMEHARIVQASGGTFNGSTHFDYTDYFEALPTAALERGLFLEADRMRAPRLTEENLANQIAVVKEEIRVNVLNRPYGGFPWIQLPGVLFDTFANAHNGYGSFVDLDGATLDDARSFFDTYYAPSNAVLAVGGDFDVEDAAALIHRHFDDIAARPRPIRPDFAEPPLGAPRRESVVDALAPMPAVAIGYRAPDPDGLGPLYLATVLLCEVLTDGDGARLVQRLVRREQVATDVGAYVGEFGDPFDEREPSVLTITLHYPQPGNLAAILRGVNAELARVATDGVPDEELNRVRTRLVATLLRDADSVLNRTLAAAKFELLTGAAEGYFELPARLAAVTAADVQSAAVRLVGAHPAVLELVAGSAQVPA